MFYPDIGDLSGARVDAGTPEGSTPDTGTGDVVQSDSGKRFCQSSVHAFCADFDDGVALKDAWDMQFDVGSAAAISTKQASSAPNSAFITMARREANAPTAYGVLNKVFTGWARTVVDFDAYIEAPAFLSGDVNSGIVTISFYSDPNIDVGVAVSAGDGYVTVGTPGTPGSGKQMPNGRWFHLHFDVDPKSSLSAKIDDEIFKDTWTSSAGSNPRTVVSIGISGYNRPAPAYNVYYDNVTIDFP